MSMATSLTNPAGVPASKAEQFDRFARFYDGDYRNYDDDINLILGIAEESGGPVLELGCGTGRVLLELLELEHEVTGVDISPWLLAVARRKLALLEMDDLYRLVEADLTDFALDQKDFGLAVCTSNTLMHLNTPEQQAALLHHAHRHLRDGGYLFIDLFNPDVARLVAVHNIMELADEWTDEVRGVHVVKWSVRAVDFAEQLQDTLFIYEETGGDGIVRRTYCPFTLRFLWRNEVELMLRSGGFDVEAVWGDFDEEPYAAESDHLILLARKR